MIPRLKPALGFRELLAALTWPDPRDVERFESSFAALAKQRRAIAFPYGRTGLVAVLKTLGLSKREVICPAYTCVVVPHAIVTSGNQPVFLDAHPRDMNMDLGLVEQAISANTGAIVSTSLFGHPVDLDSLDNIRTEYPDVPVIQDCAHSFFCEWKGRPVHKEGLCAIYGLNISKIITSIFGGMVTTDDDDFAEALRVKRESMLSKSGFLHALKRMMYLVAVYPAFTPLVYGLVNRLERSGLLDRFVKYYDPNEIDMPGDYLQTMTSLEARVGLIQCDRYPEVIAHRRRLANIYFEALQNIPMLELPPREPGSTFSHFVIRTQAATSMQTACLANSVQLGGLVDYHIPSMPPYSSYKKFGVEYARSLPGLVVNLPVHVGCTAEDANAIVDMLTEHTRLLTVN